MDWDTPIDSSSTSADLLPDGTYEFTVVDLEKSYFQPDPSSGKTACPMAIVTIRISDEDGVDHTIVDRLYLRETSIFISVNFFISLGLVKPGQTKAALPWDKAVGAVGQAQIGHREYNGNNYNKVKRWLKPKQQLDNLPF